MRRATPFQARACCPKARAACVRLTRGVAVQVVQDYEAGIEYAEAERITAARVKGDAKEYLVQWADGKAASWESEDNVRQAMVLAFEKESRGREQRGASDATPCATERREEPVAA